MNRHRSRLASTDGRFLSYEQLEDRRMLSVYTVDSIADAGPGTLRDAVLQANATIDTPDEIVFAPELAGATIGLTSGQLEVTDTLTIDASSLLETVTIDAAQTSRIFHVSETRLDLKHLTLTDGLAESGDENGGAIWSNGEVHVINSTLSHNSGRNGGAIYSEDATLFVAGSLFYRNVGSRGGAIYIIGDRTTTQIDNSTFSENLASSQAGALYASGSFITQLDINNSTLIGNRGSTIGEDPFLDLESNTDFDAIFIYNVPFTPPRAGRLVNSIVDGKLDGVSAVDTFFTPTGDLYRAFYYGDTRFDVDPLLTPLMDNGGPTLTYAALPGSPLIDVRDPTEVAYLTEFDQRGVGFHRVADGGSGTALLDIGAYEAQAAALPGDANGDDHVDAADYTVWRDHLGATVAPHTLGDADGDGDVDHRDYDVFRSHYGMFHATSLIVNDLGDTDDGDLSNGVTTLREATRAANEAFWLDTITFDPSLSGGIIEATPQRSTERLHYTRFVNYYIESPLTIDATSLPDGLTIRAIRTQHGDDTLFHINPVSERGAHNIDTTIAGLTLEGSRYQLIRSKGFGELTLRDVELRHEYAAVASAGPIHLIDSTVVDGTGGTFTGTSRAALISQSGVELTNSSIVGATGDGIRIESGYLDYAWGFGVKPLGNAVRLTDSQITGSAGRGIDGYTDVYLERSHVDDNQNGGILTEGYMYYDDEGQSHFVGGVTLVDSTVSNNVAPIGPVMESNSWRGGAGIVAARDVSLIRSRVENNTLEDDSGSAGGGITTWQSVLVVDSVVAGNAAWQGGGIYARGYIVGVNSLGYIDDQQAPGPDDIAVSLLGSSVSHNISTHSGSGIQSNYSIHIEQSSISNNTVLGSTSNNNDIGAAILMTSYTNDALITIVDSVVSANIFGDEVFAFAIYSEVGETIVDGSQIIDNESHGVVASSVIDSIISRNEGFGILASNDNTLVSGSTISSNAVGIFSERNNLLIVDSVVRGNQHAASSSILSRNGFNGAGVIGERVYIERSTIAENVLDFNEFLVNPHRGGGAGVSARYINVKDSTIRDNHVYGNNAFGGGIHGEVLWAYNTTISGNTTNGVNASGGGVYVSGLALLHQSTISGNETLGNDSHGGGLYAGTIEATHSTIYDNQVSGTGSEGGGAYITDDSTFHGTIVAANQSYTAGNDLGGPAEAEIQFLYSLLGDSSGVNITDSEGALLDTDPGLSPLADNGGPTKTHALLPGSLAINAGYTSLTADGLDGQPETTDDLLFDQRGFGRFVGTIDIGAFEDQALSLALTASQSSVPLISSTPAIEAAFTLLSQPSVANESPYLPTDEPVSIIRSNKDLLLLALARVSILNEVELFADDMLDETEQDEVEEADHDGALSVALKAYF